jgi:hypothetical protein
MIIKDLVKKLADFNRDEYGTYNEELAQLELEDAERKGCLIQYSPYCQNCPHQCNNTCPLNDWQKRHPEFVNDELTQKIEALRKETM